MKFTILPKTTLGRFSVALMGGLVLSFVIMLLMVAAGQRGGETFFSNLALAVPGFLAAICGIAAFFTGIIAIIKSKERSGLVFLAVIIGFQVLMFCLGEVLSPH